MIGSADVNWRYRDDDTDMRFVFRDAYTRNLLYTDKNRNRLSALYFGHRSLTRGTKVKLGRQTGGAGVLGRFDGAQAGYAFAPRWRINMVAGIPEEDLLDANRHFWGRSIDADAITPELSATAYGIRQFIDGRVDRSAVGTELRYFKGGISTSGTLDYDLAFRRLNIASVQGTWQREDQTVFNVLYDRRATPLLMLGNVLFFQDPSLPFATSLQALLDAGKTLGGLRKRVASITSYTTQALVGATVPMTPHWQVGADLRLTNIGEVLPVPVVLPSGQGKSDNVSVGAQLIGSNLYSGRDTHVFGLTVLRGRNTSLATPVIVDRFDGTLLTYNNSTQLNDGLQLEPSLKWYHQTDSQGIASARWSPGLRVTWRARPQLSAESELSGEHSTTSDPGRNESSNRVYYYLGARHDF